VVPAAIETNRSPAAPSGDTRQHLVDQLRLDRKHHRVGGKADDKSPPRDAMDSAASASAAGASRLDV
jgi:hypothetical protein